MRVTVIGTSGSGKTTFARRLAQLIHAPHIELDAINWQPDWHDLNAHAPEEFQRRVTQAAAQPAWVSDGNYRKVLGDIILSRATHLVWLDYPRALVMRRVIWRSFIRALTRQELWPGTGNREQFRRWLDKEHPIRWAWDTYHRRQRSYAALMDSPALTPIEKHWVRHPCEIDPLLRKLQAEALY